LAFDALAIFPAVHFESMEESESEMKFGLGLTGKPFKAKMNLYILPHDTPISPKPYKCAIILS
jgi:hypothetical protein